MGGTDEGTRNSEGEESWRHLTLPQSCRLRERRRYCTKAGAVVKVQQMSHRFFASVVMHGAIRIVMMGNMPDMLKHVLYDLVARMHEMPLPCRKYLQWEDQHEEANHNTRHETILRRLGCRLTRALSATAPRPAHREAFTHWGASECGPTS